MRFAAPALFEAGAGVHSYSVRRNRMSESEGLSRRNVVSGAMAQRSAQIATIMSNLAGAPTLRKMVIKQLGNDCFANAFHAQMLTVYPLC